MNKSGYTSKILSALDDKNKFSRDSSSEDIQLLQGTVTANLVKLHDLIAISKDKFESLKSLECKLLHMYGLPKIHKPNNPLYCQCANPQHVNLLNGQ
ncbi:unnamed protein product [Trichobilharzia regenti]|nr:unnamed protein product [Trichobilharzia regenti]